METSGIAFGDASELGVGGWVALDQECGHFHIAACLFQDALALRRALRAMPKDVSSKLFVGALPGTGEAVDINDVRIRARSFVDERFKVALKEDVLNVRLLAARIVLKRDHVYSPPRRKRGRRWGIGSIPGRRVCGRRTLGAARPIA